MPRRLKHWGWGYEDQQLTPEQTRVAASAIRKRLGFGSEEPEQPVPLTSVSLPRPRLKVPPSLAGICSTDDYERCLHAYGRSYADILRAFRGRFEHPPDVVARPASEREIAELLDWASCTGAAVIPFGGGTSVVGGVEPRVGDEYAGVVTLDLKTLHRVLEVDPYSLSARIQGGATGPGLEQQLGEHGLTLRHFPQSFEFSTLGGWIATRAGGHFTTLYTHIDDLVESVRAVTPSGVWDSRRLPGSGAGVSADRLLLGSEGTLGVITEAWVRVRRRPIHRASAAVRFEDFADGTAAVRALSQAGLYPANCRLVDAREAEVAEIGLARDLSLVGAMRRLQHPEANKPPNSESDPEAETGDLVAGAQPALVSLLDLCSGERATVEIAENLGIGVELDFEIEMIIIERDQLEPCRTQGWAFHAASLTPAVRLGGIADGIRFAYTRDCPYHESRATRSVRLSPLRTPALHLPPAGAEAPAQFLRRRRSGSVFGSP